MSEKGIDAYRVASVLGYCLLPMVGVGAISVMVTLEYVRSFRVVFVIISMLFTTAGHWAISCPYCPLSGVHTLHQGYSSLF